MTIDGSLAKEFFEQIYQTSGEYLRLNREFSSLALDDRSAFLRNITENITCFGRAMIWHFSRLNYCEPFSYLTADICKYMDADITVAKLALSLHTSMFSSSLTMSPFNTLSIVRIQDTYAERRICPIDSTIFSAYSMSVSFNNGSLLCPKYN